MGTDVRKNFFLNTEKLKHVAKPSKVTGNTEDKIRANYEGNKTLRSAASILGWATRLVRFPGAILRRHSQVGFCSPFN